MPKTIIASIKITTFEKYMMKRAWQDLAHRWMIVSEIHLLPLKTNNYKQMKKPAKRIKLSSITFRNSPCEKYRTKLTVIKTT